MFMKELPNNLARIEEPYWVLFGRSASCNVNLWGQHIVIASDTQQAMDKVCELLPDPDLWIMAFSGKLDFIAKLLRKLEKNSIYNAQFGLKQFLAIVKDCHENMLHPILIPGMNSNAVHADVVQRFRSDLGLAPNEDTDRCRLVAAIEYSLLAKVYKATLEDFESSRLSTN